MTVLNVFVIVACGLDAVCLLLGAIGMLVDEIRYRRTIKEIRKNIEEMTKGENKCD